MFIKKIIVSTFVVAVSLSLFGTAIAGTSSSPLGFISNLDFSTAETDAKLESMEKTGVIAVKQATVSAPAGVISNLDSTTAEIDSQLYTENMDSKKTEYVSCSVPAGYISNLDFSTAELDARYGC